MSFPEIGTVAFVIAWVAFFTTQFNLNGKIALLCAFGVSLFFALAPLVKAAYPQVGPALDVVLNTILLTVSAAGGYDFITKLVGKVGSSK